MKICFVQAPVATQYADAVEFGAGKIRIQSCEPQLGILSIAAIAEGLGWETSIFDLNRRFFEFADAVGELGLDSFAAIAASEIAKREADVYGFGSICSGYPLTLRIAKLVKELHPEATILFGGPQASVVAQPTLVAFPFVDFVLRGESEESLPVFLEELFGGRNFGRVLGLTYRSILGIQQNADAPPILDLDVLPSPAYHLTGELLSAHQASLELGRGCPYACTFCSTNDFFRRRFRLRSAERVLQDMREIEAEYGIRHFTLTHDMFTVDAKRVRAFCHHLIASGTGYRWSCSARTDSVDEELLELMAAAGCNGVFFGVETGSERMQKIIDKHLDIRRAHEIIDVVERTGMTSTVSLIMGFPEETWEDLRDTIRMFMHAARTPKASPQLNILAPLSNTPMHLNHRHEMVLDELCSAVSHQGSKQDAEDVELISRYPDIFSSFYLLPTPHMDRELLFELREFMLMGTFRFRWLLGAVDQAGDGILDVFVEWAACRRLRHSELTGLDIRHYYRTPEFVAEFVAFLRNHPVSSDQKVGVFLNFQQVLSEADTPMSPCVIGAQLLPASVALVDSDILVRTNRSCVVEFDEDIEMYVNAVRDCKTAERAKSRQYYVVPQELGGQNLMCRVSPRLAKVVEACDGRRDVKEVMEILASQIQVVPSEAGRLVFGALLERAAREKLISIYRRVSRAGEIQEGEGLAVEYNESITVASRQNHRSIHVQ